MSQAGFQSSIKAVMSTLLDPRLNLKANTVLAVRMVGVDLDVTALDLDLRFDGTLDFQPIAPSQVQVRLSGNVATLRSSGMELARELYLPQYPCGSLTNAMTDRLVRGR